MPTETVKEEEMEQTLMSTPVEGEEHSAELLKIFSQEAEQEMTVALELTEEEEADNMDFVDLYAEMEALERRVMVQSLHIQQVKLETDRGAYQPEKRLEGVGNMPAQEEVEQQLSDETAGLESIAEWQLNATRGDKDNMGDRVDLPLIRRKSCSREDCIRRANHWSSWTE
jgi:hypothetical protein